MSDRELIEDEVKEIVDDIVMDGCEVPGDFENYVGRIMKIFDRYELKPKKRDLCLGEGLCKWRDSDASSYDFVCTTCGKTD